MLHLRNVSKTLCGTADYGITSYLSEQSNILLYMVKLLDASKVPLWIPSYICMYRNLNTLTYFKLWGVVPQLDYFNSAHNQL